MPKKRKYPNQVTERQLDLLFFIREYYRLNQGRPPAIRDIMINFNFKSPRCVTFHTEKLIAKGLLKKQPGHRGLIPTSLQEQKIILQNLSLR